MYQFTTTTVINSNLDSNGTTAKFAGSAAGFNVTRVNSFKADKIVSVYKRAYSAGVKEVAYVTVPTVDSGKVVRLNINVKLSQQTDSEYASIYLDFQKPIVVEVLSTGTAATDATNLVAQLKGLKDRFGTAYITAAIVSGAQISLTATTNNQRFASVKVEKEIASTNSIVQPEYEDVTSTTFSIHTKGKIGFGDDEYMIRSIMIPTVENTRYFGMNKEERPIIGGNYTEYVIRYSIEKTGDDGIYSGAKSITTHVFYVKSDLVSSFDTELVKAKAIVTIGGVGSIAVTGTASLANNATSQLSATNYVTSVTYAVTSGTSATVSSAGLVTASAATDGDTVVTATDALGNTGTITIVVA